MSNPAASFPQLATAARAKYGAGASVADLATGWLNDRAAVVQGHDRTARAWNDGFFRGGTVQADGDLQVAYWTGKEIGARPPAEYLSAGRKVINYNDEYLYYVLGEPQTFVYPTGQRIYEQWTPLVLRGTAAVPAKYDPQILGGSFAVWCDLANSQTQDQIAASTSGCRCAPRSRSCGIRAGPSCRGRSSRRSRSGWAERLARAVGPGRSAGTVGRGARRRAAARRRGSKALVRAVFGTVGAGRDRLDARLCRTVSSAYVFVCRA